MIIKGVSDTELLIITDILAAYKNKYEFYCYGSRVKEDFRFLSDLDLMIKSNNKVEYEDIENLKENFDKSNLPYVVNISDFAKFDKNFYKSIEKDLVKIQI